MEGGNGADFITNWGELPGGWAGLGSTSGSPAISADAVHFSCHIDHPPALLDPWGEGFICQLLTRNFEHGRDRYSILITEASPTRCRLRRDFGADCHSLVFFFFLRQDVSIQLIIVEFSHNRRYELTVQLTATSSSYLQIV